MPYELLADAVLVLHFAIVVFVVGGLVVVLAWRVYPPKRNKRKS